MIDPERPVKRRVLTTALAAAVAGEIGKGITKDGVAVDMKDGQAPVFVPAELVEHMTGQPMPRPLRCGRTRHRKNAAARRKMAKASRRNNR